MKYVLFKRVGIAAYEVTEVKRSKKITTGFFTVQFLLLLAFDIFYSIFSVQTFELLFYQLLVFMILIGDS